MKLNFNISEFNISGKDIPQDVADKILHYHILPMQPVRNELGYWITASENSGYRSEEWEKSRDRSGNSQHTFKVKGAVDWTCEHFSKNKDEFLKAIIKHTNYTRIAVYNTFIHCDYKPTGGKRQLFTSDASSNWKFEKFV